MFRTKFFSSVKVALCGALAMTCVSCAHQSREASLMIDKEAPSEEHVWSESKNENETVAAEEKSEEAQLDAIAQQTESDTSDAVAENGLSKEMVAEEAVKSACDFEESEEQPGDEGSGLTEKQRCKQHLRLFPLLQERARCQP